MTQAQFLRMAIPAAAIALTTAAFYSTQTQWPWVHSLLQHLYFVPIAAAAVSFGWRGGLTAAVVSALCYAPHFLRVWQAGVEPLEYMAAEATEIVDFFVVGLVTGVLTGRERRQRDELHKTTEQMKRSERLYAIGQLSAGLAHEIRNPLASIEGAAAILRKNNTDQKRREEFLEIIEKESERLNRLLTHFLEFAKPRPPQYRQVALDQVIESVAGLAAHQPVKLKLDLAVDLPAVTCDPELIKQVVLNLAINAIQATPDGYAVDVATKRRNDRVAIQVRDHGPGIPAEHLERIFDPFFTTKDAGTGLGLSVAHQIIAQHGGILSAKNNPEGGATFVVELPLQPGSAL